MNTNGIIVIDLPVDEVIELCSHDPDLLKNERIDTSHAPLWLLYDLGYFEADDFTDEPSEQ